MKVISFFSFKGGVGRTTLLSNLGAYWAAQGKVVVLMDLDLAAPGLSYSPYLLHHLDPRGQTRGMSDVLLTFFEKWEKDQQNIEFMPPHLLLHEMAVPPRLTKKAPGRLFLIPAGQKCQELEHWSGKAGAKSSGTEIHAIPRPGLTQPGEDRNQTAFRQVAHHILEDLKHWRVPEGHAQGAPIDYLLVDSRTGFAELVDLSLGYLADQMVLVSGLNRQNLKGLEHTLEALQTEKRLPLGCFPGVVTVVFSPVPTEDESVFQCLTEAHSLIKEKMRTANTPSGQESPPKIFSIHYTPILATREALLTQEQPNSLYARETETIAHHLEGISEKDDVRDNLLERLERYVFKNKKPKNEGSEIDKNVESTGFLKLGLSENPLMGLLPWHWPLLEADETQKNQKLNEIIPENLNIKIDRWRFLNKLAWSFGLVLQIKKAILETLPQVDQEAIDNLENNLDETFEHWMKAWPEDASKLIQSLYQAQLDWANLLLKDAIKAQNLVLVYPLTHGAWLPQLENNFLYWWFLAEELSTSFKEYLNAEQAYKRAIKENANTPYIWNGLGNLLKDHLGRYAEAEAAYQKAISLDEKYTSPWNGLGNLLTQHLGRYAEAEAAYQKAISLDEKDASPWNGLGNLLQDHLGRYAEAEAAYQKAISLDEKYASPWNGLGNLLMQHLGRYAEAEAAYQKAISLDEKLPHLWNNLGQLYSDHLGRYAEAEAAYQKAISLDEKLPHPWNNLGQLYKNHLERYAEAEAAYQKAISLDEKDAFPWNGLGNLLQDHLGRYAEAEAAYRKAISLDEKLPHPWNGLGNLLMQHLGRYAEAEAAYQKAISLDEKYASPWNGLGNLLTQHLGRYAEAEAAYQKAISLDEKFAPPWNGLGNLLKDHLGRYAEAEAAYQKAISLDEKYASPWNGLGLLQLWVQHTGSVAAQSFTQGLRVASQSDTIAYLQMNLGSFTLLTGERSQALDLTRSALEGFAQEKNLSSNTLGLAVQLQEEAAMHTWLEPTRQRWETTQEWDYALSLLLYAIGQGEREAIESWQKRTEQALKSHEAHFQTLQQLYVLAGFRPEVRENAQRLAKELLNIPAERSALFRDLPKPEPLLAPFRDFAEGLSQGAGDPRDLAKFGL